MSNVSVFRNFTKVIGSRSIEQIIAAIRSGEYKTQIEAIRKAIELGQKEQADQLKKQLLGFTVSGVFKGGRRLEHLLKYRPLVVLDFDDVEATILKNVLVKIREDSYTRAGFISPGGRGVKVIIAIDGEATQHQEAFEQVAKYFERILKIKVDQSGKDITRLCYFSYDPAAYLNLESEVFTIQKSIEHFQTSLNSEQNYKSQFLNCITFTEQKTIYQNGNRNNFIYLLASNCNRVGIPLDAIQDLAKAQFDLPEKELKQTILSAYKKGYDEFGTRKIPPPKHFSKTSFSVAQPKTISSPPCMPQKIFDQLPQFLQQGCATFKDPRERDVFLTGALTVLSGCLPKVKGIYDRRTHFPNLYSFIIAPAASGKGALSFAKELGLVYHQQLLQKSKDARKEYKAALQRYEVALFQHKKGQGTELPLAPDKPPFQLLYIPANSSSAMLIQHLLYNDGSGILFESESDTLGNVLKQDWGGYSDLLRKAFHHEPISYSRKQGEEFAEINAPKLSVAISGTPNQVIKLIPSVEDGLFSRFLFYLFEVETKWRDVSPKGGGENLEAMFQQMSQQVLSMVEYLEKHPTTVQLREKQWTKLNEVFTKQLQETNAFVGGEALSIVKRLGVILFRMAMILTALRKFEVKEREKVLFCRDDDFETALWLVEHYLQHALFLYERLPQKQQSSFQQMPINKRQFLEALPNRFRRKEAIRIGQSTGLSSATVDRFLQNLMGDVLDQPEYGVYQKKAR